jgi:two-component system phosphate regulon sensor histidine kinase PhoR
MHHLIDDILELSFIESGGIALAPKSVNLHSLIEEIFTNLSGKAKQQRVRLKNEVPKETFVFADAVRLEQMLTNLVDNAVKFNVRAGGVTVGFARKDERDIISVSDTGEGISSEHLQRIFERFYRTDRARSREIGGTGLGLAIVKHLARLHGGEVSVASNPGKGSIFSVELPSKSAQRMIHPASE